MNAAGGAAVGARMAASRPKLPRSTTSAVRPLIVREEVARRRADPRSDGAPPSARPSGREAALERALGAAEERIRELEEELAIERDARGDAEEACRRARADADRQRESLEMMRSSMSKSA